MTTPKRGRIVCVRVCCYMLLQAATCCYMLLHGNSAKRTCSIRCSKMEEGESADLRQPHFTFNSFNSFCSLHRDSRPMLLHAATCCYMLLHGNSAKRTCSIRCSKMEENGRKWKLDAQLYWLMMYVKSPPEPLFGDFGDYHNIAQ